MAPPLKIVKTEPVTPLSVVSSAPIPELPKPSAFQQFLAHPLDSIDKLTTVTPEQRAGHSPLFNAAQNFGAGALGATLGVIAHPYDSLKTGVKGALYNSPVGALMDPAGNPMLQQAKKIIADPENELPQLAGSLVGGTVGSEALGSAGGKLRSIAATDPNAAALRGLQIGPKSSKALGTLQSVEGARPFLSGAQNLEDLQGKIKPAKAEIWKPYNDALEAIGDRTVNGPDGPTTVAELEKERLQLSAINRGLKSKVPNPEAVQLAQQKGLNQAQALAKEDAVKRALDPELASTGINPTAIRKAFGQVSQVGGQISGKTTLIEPEQPSGLGKIANLDIKKPLKAPLDIASGLRDIVAGRPFLSAKPTDLGIREGFALGGPKPDFGRVMTTGKAPPPAALLGSGAIPLSAPPELGGTPLGYEPPPIAGDTIPMRKGRLLPAGIPARDLPLSSYSDIFPDQLPQGRLIEVLKKRSK